MTRARAARDQRARLVHGQLVVRHPQRALQGLPLTLQSFDAGRQFVADRLEPGQEAQADLLVRLALTYVLIPGPLADEQAARAFARVYLAPIATASATSAPRAG